MAYMAILVPQFFDNVDEEDTKRRCLTCQKLLKMSGKSGCNLVQHLDRNHKPVAAEYHKLVDKFKEEKASSSAKTKKVIPISSQITKHVEYTPYKPGSKEEKTFHDMVLEMIVVDNQPFAIAEKPGFRNLLKWVSQGKAEPNSETFYRNKLEDFYKSTCDKLKAIVSLAEPHSAATTDAWSIPSHGICLLSLTLNILVKERRRKIILSAMPFDEAHTGDNVELRLGASLNDWLPAGHCVALLTDGGSNFLKGARQLGEATGLKPLQCAQHMAQLVVNAGIDAHPAVTAVIGKCSTLTAHFNRSTASSRALEEVQQELQLPVLRTKTYSDTRWDGKLEMVKRVVQLATPLAVLHTRAKYADLKLPEPLTGEEIRLAQAAVAHLQLFHEFTLEMSSDTATLGLVIPFIKRLQRYCEPGDGDVEEMKAAHLRQLKTKFAPQLNSHFYMCATAMDPRFKGAHFEEGKLKIVEDMLEQLYAFYFPQPLEEEDVGTVETVEEQEEVDENEVQRE